MITQLKEKVLNGGQITREEAILLSNAVDKQALYRAAGEIRDKRVGRSVRYLLDYKCPFRKMFGEL